MKILIATAVYYPMINGVSVFAHNLAMGLAGRGHEIMVVCPSQTGHNYSRTIDGVKTVYLRSVEAKIYPDQIHPVPKAKKLLGFKMPKLWYKHGFRVSVFPAPEIKKVLDGFHPDVVHVQVSDPIGLSVVFFARKRGIPVVTTEHNQPEVLTDPLKMPDFMKKPANMILSAYFRNRQSKSDFVTMPTEQAIRHLFREGKEINVPVAAVSNGVDLSYFKPGPAPKEIYKKYSLPEDKPIILYVGRLDPEKKVGLVIEALSMLRQKLPDVMMVIAGDGVDKLHLEKKVDELELTKQVRFLGRVDKSDLNMVYKLGTVFATASEIETQGIVLIEAAASGLPLVAVDKGAVSEVCVNNKNGFLCPAGDVAAISQALEKILTDEDLRKRFAENSVKIAGEHDFERTLDKFINIYTKVISDKNMV